MRVAEGARDERGRWVPDDPSRYGPLDVAGAWPLSVIQQSAREWQDRKRWWLARFEDSPIPRAHAVSMMNTGRHGGRGAGVSMFDPVLAEALLSWFSCPGDRVVDPFAGGPVRGAVAAELGRAYEGVDLSEAQVSANRAAVVGPSWVVGAAQDHEWTWPADYLLTCPPYHRLERYSDDPRDLSAMSWPGFVDALGEGLGRAFAALRDDRFASVVISDVRDYRGHYRGLPHVVDECAAAAGLHLVNVQVVVQPIGLARKRLRPAWEAARTTCRVHQYARTYVKGDRRVAGRRCQDAWEARGVG